MTTVTTDEAIRNIGIITGIIIGLVIGRAAAEATIRHRAERLTRYLMSELGKCYFCGYDLWQLYVLRFFPRYREFVDWGFCGPVAALSMMALRDNPTARYVYALAGPERYEHCWCEFRYCGIWYVLDVCWYYPFVVPRRLYYRRNRPEILQVCEHQQFWDLLVSRQIRDKMAHPETSWLISEFVYLYNFSTVRGGPLFAPDIDEYDLDDTVGRHINPYLIVVYPEIIFSRRIIYEMMQRSTRKRPPAHLVRFVRSRSRKLRQAWAESHPEEA